MAQNPGAALLVAVTRAVRAATKDEPKRQSNGGYPMWWPLIAQAIRYIDPSETAKPDNLADRYRRLKAKLTPEALGAMAASVDPETYREAIKHVLDNGEAPAGAPPVLPGVAETKDAQEEEPQPEEPEEPEMFPPQLVSGVSLEEKGDIIFEDRRPQPSGDDVDKLLAAYLAVMDASKPFKTAQREARVTLKGNLPIGMSFFGDQHTGGWGWAARRMLEDYRLVAETEGLYMNLLGDDWDNFIFDFAKWASVMPPDHQRRITERLMEGLKPKVVSAVIGNHVHWTKKSADFDMAARLAWIADAVFLGHRGHLYVTVGSQTYHHYLAHRAQGPSVINKSNSGRRTADDIGGAAVIVEADRHDPWLHQEYRARKRQTWLRSGTYKVEDDYPDELGFPQGKWDMPMVILMPDTQRVIPFLDFRDGIDTLAFLRTKYQHGRTISA